MIITIQRKTIMVFVNFERENFQELGKISKRVIIATNDGKTIVEKL